jgi:PhzF family phenazine biosynthesis protein
MNTIPIYQIDAFAKHLFQGNPAAICPLEEWLSDELMQQIAMENNLSETAFFVWEGEDKIRIRFFTPEVEIDLCGHATLATAHLIFSQLKPQLNELKIQANKDLLKVKKEGELVVMDFPSNKPVAIETPEGLKEALGNLKINSTFQSGSSMLALIENKEQVNSCIPNFVLLKNFPGIIIITAKGRDCDFVSRVFGPSVGINEDPVTGSAHTLLIPFWSERLNKTKMTARQVSKRGGELFVEDKGERVIIAGKSKLYLKGEIYI